MHHEGDNGLAMGLLMQRPAAVGVDHPEAGSRLRVQGLDLGGYVEEALGAQK